MTSGSRFIVTLKHDETGEHQGWSIAAQHASIAVAKAQQFAGGARWQLVAIEQCKAQ